MAGREIRHPRPYIRPASSDGTEAEGLKVQSISRRASESSFGDTGLSVRVQGPERFPSTLVVQPFDPAALIGIDLRSLRAFRWDARSRAWKPRWESGVNVGLNFVWVVTARRDEFRWFGLPVDRMLREVLGTLARQRLYIDQESREEMEELTRLGLRPIVETSAEELHALRVSLARIEVQTTLQPRSELPITMGRGGYLDAFPLPGGITTELLQERLQDVQTPPGGFPEEALLFPPESMVEQLPPWPVLSESWPPPIPWPIPDHWPEQWHNPWPWPPPWFCWLRPRDWRMYQHDREHSGHASGCSGITSASVGGLSRRQTVTLNGSIISVPSIVRGKVYVGTANNPGGYGTLYKIDLHTGAIDASFDTPVGTGYYAGIGGSPAVVDGRVYLSNIPGSVHCLDASTMTELWHTDLRNPNSAQNQPVNNPIADCWTGPVVVHDRVYVGSGEGESGAYGFVFCLDAATGQVVWLFSTNQSNPPADNVPNAIPQGAAISDPLPPWALAAGFSIAPEPPFKGCSVWSSPAYDGELHRLYVGTGNSGWGDSNPNPDQLYGSGVLALDAATGNFHGFYSPSAAESYLPSDDDADVCGSPIVFEHEDRRYVAIGSKAGAFFLFEAATMNLVRFRQLLPYLDDNPATPLNTFDVHVGPDENKWGVFGTPAIHYGLNRLFVGLGGYVGVDPGSTPFMRAIHCHTLHDAWATHVVGGVRKYTVPVPPMYTTAEAGLSCPSVTNDVVFVGTSLPALYAFHATNGHCLWSDTALSGGALGSWVLGAAIYGRFVVAGAGNNLNIYSL